MVAYVLVYICIVQLKVVSCLQPVDSQLNRRPQVWSRKRQPTHYAIRFQWPEFWETVGSVHFQRYQGDLLQKLILVEYNSPFIRIVHYCYTSKCNNHALQSKSQLKTCSSLIILFTNLVPFQTFSPLVLPFGNHPMYIRPNV